MLKRCHIGVIEDANGVVSLVDSDEPLCEAHSIRPTCLQAVLDCDVERNQLMDEEKRLMAEASASGRGGATASADAASSRLKEVYDRLLEIDADGAPARAASILAGLSFDEAMQKRATKTFSGGAPL